MSTNAHQLLGEEAEVMPFDPLGCLVPFLMMVGAYVLYKKHYILDEEEYDRIVAELAERSK